MKTMKNQMMVLGLLFIALVCSIHMNAQNYTIYPIPQKMTMGSQMLTLTSNVNVVVEDGIDVTIIDRIKEVLEKSGHTYTMGSAAVDDATNLIVGVVGSGQVADQYAINHQISKDVFVEADNKFDSHILQLNVNHAQGDIFVLGNAEGSAFYAFATLEQLLEQAQDNVLQTVTFEDYAFVKMRGIVEGFYGHTYSVADRLDLFDYCKRYKMNAFLYGPKSDPYHTGLWRDEYPITVTEEQRFMGMITQDDVRLIAEKAKACHVDFIWSIHPALQGGGINFYDLDPGVAEIMVKFQHMYDLGVRHFGVSIDDMPGHPNTQHELADKVQRQLIGKFNTDGATEENKVGPLVFVPSQYALNYGTYTLPPFKNIHKDVEIIFTGYDCFSNIREIAFMEMEQLIGKKPIMWWNNPVNDDHDDYLYMHGLTARWTIEDRNPIPSMGGLLMNPMNQAHASKVCLFGAADYAWNPAKFQDQENWKASLKSILKEQPLYDALEQFIRVMSSYSQNSEGEEYAPLYDAFRRNFSKDNIPDATDLLSKMDAAYEACVLLQTLKTSETASYRLFYADIAPWLNKVQSMTDIVRKSIRLMDKEAGLTNWTTFAQVQEDIAKIHVDSLFFLSVLEGSGTDTYDTFREAQPTPNGLDNFVTFLSEQLSDFMPKLPTRNRDIEVISNQEGTLAQVDATAGIALGGLNQLTLSPGEYVGLNFNAIKAAIIETLPEEVQTALAVEYSINGKEWTPFVPDGQTEQEMVYFRLKNTGVEAYILPISKVKVDLGQLEYSKPLFVRTNMTPYQDYIIEKVIDDNVDTKFWSNRVQSAGDYIEVDYGSITSRYDIELYFDSGDRPSGTVSVQVSKDAIAWETVSRFTQSDIAADGKYVCDAKGKSARFVRLYIESANGGYWFQMKEFKVKAGSKFIPVAMDEQGNEIDCLDDSSLAFGYTAKTAGHLIYRFIENITIDEVQIYHNSKLDTAYPMPEIFVLSEDEWVKVGELNEPCTIISLEGYKNLSQLKIEWKETNIPSIYEIYPIGEPYVEDIPTTGLVETEQTSEFIWKVESSIVAVSAPQKIEELIVMDADGVICQIYQPNSTSFKLVLLNKGLWLVKVQTVDGQTQVRKCLAY